MSLSVARYAAYSSMMTTQTQIAVASNNIANADTDGYTTKTANQVSTQSGSIGSGTTIASITSNVDKLLMKSLTQSASALGAATTTDSYASQLQSLFGSTTSSTDDTGTSLANTLASLQTALSELADTPESSTLKAQVVNGLDDLAAQLRETSSQVQSLRANADQSIASDVDSANSLLNTIDDLNKQITAADAAGSSTADLEDQRNTALNSLAALMDINYYTNSSGAVQIYTGSGKALLDGSVHALSFSAAGTVTADSSYVAGGASSGLSGITVDGTDITSQITSGSIGAALEQRDETLPAVQAELDQFATQLADTLNSASNAGTSDPPPNSLTGTTAVSNSDALSASGTFRVAVTDSDGNLVSYQDFDLSSYSTVGDLVSAIDGVSGLSAGIDGDGHVTIAADDASNGVAVNEMTSAVGGDGEGLADWLGLNDVVSATGASDFRVSGDLLSDSSLLPSAALSSDATLTVGAQVVSEGSMSVAQDMADALTSTQSFDAAGDLSARNTTLTSYVSDIIAQVASAATDASSTLTVKQTVNSNLADTISSQSGVNVDEETARLTELQNQYAAAAQVLQAINSMFTTLLNVVESS